MKFSYRWLSELVEGLDVPAAELARLITMKTAECEGVEETGAHLKAVCLARVETVEPIPGAGQNQRVVVETGRYGRKTVVCGAPNCRAGMITAYVPPATALGAEVITTMTLHGVTSEGMLASGAELGLNRDKDGILELQGAPGDPVPGCAPDFIIEIDNKSLTHRPDLWGHLGLAREVAAILRRRLNDPVRMELVPSGAAPIRVEIEDYTLAPRYSGLVFENVTVQSSPLWLQARLEAVGINPINNIVDVTNYIMAELAQPMHAFDRATLHGEVIYVRRAKPQELLVALNGEAYRLDPAHLVIADGRGAIALAGVMGGQDSGINERTTSIVLESANFHGATIRRTSAALKLRTDASMRFEKSQDPENTVRAIARAIELFAAVSPGIRVVGGVADAYAKPPAPAPIEVSLTWMERKLGRPVSAQEAKDILERLQFGVDQPDGERLVVAVPSWRATKDVSIKDDIVEEVGRILGYDTIAPAPPRVEAAPPPFDVENIRFPRRVRSICTALGFTEVHNYSFVSEEDLARFALSPEQHVKLANPIARDQEYMRSTLVPNIWKNLQENSKHWESFRLFEIGEEIRKRQEGKLPEEVTHLAAAVYSRHGDDSPLFELKHLAECLCPGAEVRAAAALSYEHPTRAGEVWWRDQAVGRLFEFHPRMLTGRGAVLNLNLAMVRKLETRSVSFKPIRRFPASSFDLSVVAGLREPVGELQAKMAALAGEALESIVFVRQFSQPPIPEGKKSVSFRLTVASQERTLSLAEVGEIRQRIIDGLTRQGYELRI